MMNHRVFGMLVAVLSAIGAINWGLVGLFNFDLVVFLLGSMPMLVKVVYILVGICGVLLLFTCQCIHKNCKMSDSSNSYNNSQV